jgi:murein DD-endopeptidase MepM/ murein hydrolase activator NlpD
MSEPDTAAPAPAADTTTPPPPGASGSTPAPKKDFNASTKPKDRKGFDSLSSGLQGLILTMIQVVCGNFADDTTTIEIMAQMMGMEPDELRQKMNERTERIKAARDKGETVDDSEGIEDIARSGNYDKDDKKTGDLVGQVITRVSGKSSYDGNKTGLFLNRPVDKSIATSSSYGDRTLGGKHEHHDGLDYLAPDNTQIKAPADGKVVYVGPSTGYGNIIVIDHGHGVYTLYAHLDKADIAKVRTGQEVKQDEVFATTGTSGRSTGAHLHQEVLIARKDGPPVTVNPALVAGKDLNDPVVQQELIANAVNTAKKPEDTVTRVAALRTTTMA